VYSVMRTDHFLSLCNEYKHNSSNSKLSKENEVEIVLEVAENNNNNNSTRSNHNSKWNVLVSMIISILVSSLLQPTPTRDVTKSNDGITPLVQNVLRNFKCPECKHHRVNTQCSLKRCKDYCALSILQILCCCVSHKLTKVNRFSLCVTHYLVRQIDWSTTTANNNNNNQSTILWTALIKVRNQKSVQPVFVHSHGWIESTHLFHCQMYQH
jgi:hypothetical protein